MFSRSRTIKLKLAFYVVCFKSIYSQNCQSVWDSWQVPFKTHSHTWPSCPVLCRSMNVPAPLFPCWPALTLLQPNCAWAHLSFLICEVLPVSDDAIIFIFSMLVCTVIWPCEMGEDPFPSPIVLCLYCGFFQASRWEGNLHNQPTNLLLAGFVFLWVCILQYVFQNTQKSNDPKVELDS